MTTEHNNLSAVSKDLVNKINVFAAFGGRVALTLGGTEADPTMTKLALPYAWVIPVSSQNTSANRESWTKARQNFTVLIRVSYGKGESDFADTQLPLIEEVAAAVCGSHVNANVRGPKWSYDGRTLLGSDKKSMTFALQFGVDTYYTKST